MNTQFNDRAAGVLLGTACGDALGAGYEGGPPLPDDVPIAMIGRGFFAPGEWTDDTSMAVAVAEAAAKGLDLRTGDGLDHVADGFLRWYADGHKGIGRQTRAVLRASNVAAGTQGRFGARASSLRRPRSGYGCRDGKHLTGPSSEPPVQPFDAAPFGRQDEQCPPVRPAERTGEAATVEFDRLQDLATLAYSDASTGSGTSPYQTAPSVSMQVPSGTVAQLCPRPPVGQAAVGGDVERGEPAGEGLGDDQRRFVGSHDHALRKRDRVGNLAAKSNSSSDLFGSKRARRIRRCLLMVSRRAISSWQGTWRKSGRAP